MGEEDRGVNCWFCDYKKEHFGDGVVDIYCLEKQGKWVGECPSTITAAEVPDHVPIPDWCPFKNTNKISELEQKLRTPYWRIKE